MKCKGCGFCCWYCPCDLVPEYSYSSKMCHNLIFDQKKKRHFCKLIIDDPTVIKQFKPGCGAPMNPFQTESPKDRTLQPRPSLYSIYG